MPENDVPPLSDFVADELKKQSKPLTREWVEELGSRLGVRPARLVPTDALLDHIPHVLEGIAEFVRVPVEAVRSSVAGHLRLLAQLRREQGYDISELLVEFEVLSRITSEEFVKAVEKYPGPADPVEVARLSGRVREGLSGITSATVGTYRQEEQEQKRELARRLSEFARTLAHELKTPLNAASVAMHMLQEEELTSEPKQQRRFTELVIRNLGRATDLLSDIRVLALSEGAQAEDRRIGLSEVVRDVLDSMSEPADARGVELRVEGDLPVIHVDAVRVEIALVNLVSNAIKYADLAKEERFVEIAATEIREGHMARGWRIRVEDNGLGIPTAVQNKVFQRHFRAHPEVAEGTGLGLAITESVVVQKGGEISFESTEGKGSVFYIDIPERQTQAEHEGESAS